MPELIESRVANPVTVADWSDVEEGQGVRCACCGWSGRLGECARAASPEARVYACDECGMALVARVYPVIIDFTGISSLSPRRWSFRLAANG